MNSVLCSFISVPILRIAAGHIMVWQKTFREGTVENGQEAKANSEIRQLIQENSKPQDLIVYTNGSITKTMQSGWGLTVKRCATTIHEDSAAHEVSTSSLAMEMEAVTHAIRWIASRGDSQTCHHSHRFKKVKSGKGKPRLACVKVRHPPSKNHVGVMSWTCRSQMKRQSRSIDWRAKQPSQAVCVSRTSHHRSPGGQRRRQRKRSTIFLERTRKGHRQSDQHWNWNCFNDNIG